MKKLIVSDTAAAGQRRLRSNELNQLTIKLTAICRQMDIGIGLRWVALMAKTSIESWVIRACNQ